MGGGKKKEKVLTDDAQGSDLRLRRRLKELQHRPGKLPRGLLECQGGNEITQKLVLAALRPPSGKLTHRNNPANRKRDSLF